MLGQPSFSGATAYSLMCKCSKNLYIPTDRTCIRLSISISKSFIHINPQNQITLALILLESIFNMKLSAIFVAAAAFAGVAVAFDREGAPSPEPRPQPQPDKASRRPSYSGYNKRDLGHKSNGLLAR